MIADIDITKKPFNLTAGQAEKVEERLSAMNTEEKVGQVFCPIVNDFEEDKLSAFAGKYMPGGIMYRPGPSKEIRKAIGALQEASPIPLLTAANLESGGNGIVSDGTYYARPMEVGATGDTKYAYRLGVISGREAAAVGCNWSFAPICDPDINFKNPIINVRSFGRNPDRVIANVKEQLKGLSEYGIAAAAKHFPGDGVDDRDQHLLPSVNTLSVEEYDGTYGKIWKEVIESGVLSIMVGHILQPAYTRYFNPEIKDQDIRPATLSPEILQGLLRKKLGFNGMIVTDATPMIGFNAVLPRKQAVPAAIASGCDMILFNKNIDEDYEAVHEALENGTLAMERLDEAVYRILAMKEAMGLFEKKEEGTLVPGPEGMDVISCKEHREWTRECADQAVTLVKNKENILPISPGKTRRVRLYYMEDRTGGAMTDAESAVHSLQVLLEKEGFEVTVYDQNKPDFHEMFEEGVSDLKAKFDLAIYAANYDTASNHVVRRVDFMPLMAADAPWFLNDIPAIFISFANPYHLYDVPMVKTYINAYTPNAETVEAVVEKLVGRSEFKGVSPVDPFCGTFGTDL